MLNYQRYRYFKRLWTWSLLCYISQEPNLSTNTLALKQVKLQHAAVYDIRMKQTKTKYLIYNAISVKTSQYKWSGIQLYTLHDYSKLIQLVAIIISELRLTFGIPIFVSIFVWPISAKYCRAEMTSRKFNPRRDSHKQNHSMGYFFESDVRYPLTLQGDTKRLISQFDGLSSSKCWRKPTICTLE